MLASLNAFAQSAPSTPNVPTPTPAAVLKDEDRAQLEALRQQVAAIASQRQTEQTNLANFDDLDFNVYSGQKWDELTKSHSPDIIVHMPDGSVTTGLPAHVEELKPMFVFAPDTRIKEHPIRIASGEWTAVSGYVEGTFSQPMPIGGGKTISPTGKPFKLGMVTIGRWNKDGVMEEEWLYWDNQSLMKQIGLAQ
ncbi:TPA: ester cyclase [Enterobacter cloacae]|nr:ester cyclase [Enterobacter cloacae]